MDQFLRREAYGSLADYMRAVDAVHGKGTSNDIVAGIERARDLYTDESALDPEAARRDAAREFGPLGFFLTVPEPDFLTALEIGLGLAPNPYARAGLPDRINHVCDRRGLPYRVEGVSTSAVFKWIGDATVQHQVLEPALSALNDPRLAAGAGAEFNAAREELRKGTPGTRKQAVAEACNAVESALKVLLQEHQQALPAKESLDSLLNACVAANLIATEARELVASAGRFGNRRGRHGGGAVAHAVTSEEAESVVAAAAVAVTFIARLLP